MNKFYRLLRYDWPMHFVYLLTNWMPDNVALIRFRGWLMSPFFFKAGKNIQVGRDVTFYNPSKIELGDSVYIAKGCWLCGGENIRIGDKVLLGPYVVIVTSNHSIKDGTYYDGPPVKADNVDIGYGSWIGAHVTILGGTMTGDGTMVAANSVISGTTENFSIYGGVPAKFIKYADKTK